MIPAFDVELHPGGIFVVVGLEELLAPLRCPPFAVGSRRAALLSVELEIERVLELHVGPRRWPAARASIRGGIAAALRRYEDEGWL